jgi:hypothetical protein
MLCANAHDIAALIRSTIFVRFAASLYEPRLDASPNGREDMIWGWKMPDYVAARYSFACAGQA